MKAQAVTPRRVIVAAVVLLGVAVLLILAPRIERLAGHAVGASSSRAASSAAPGAPAVPPIGKAGAGAARVAGVQPGPATPGRAFRPMPPVDTPLRLAYPRIKEQADAGDAVAQCRLAEEVSRCQRLPERIRSMKETAPRFRRQPNGAAAVAFFEKQIAKDTAVCQDFTPDPGDTPWRLMLQSALNGNRAAALQFTMGPGLDPTGFTATPEELAAYREYAPRLLQEAIADGDSRAFQIAAIFAPFSERFGVRLVPADPVQDAAYLLALLPIAASSYRPFLQKQVDGLHLGNAQLAEARARAATLGMTLKPPPDGEPLVGDNIVGWGKWTDGADCEH